MYIEPNTIIHICRNVPLDTTYKNTLYFDSSSAQNSYFSSKSKYTLTNQSYQRVEKGRMRVQIKAENLYDCNYLCYQNSSFGTKWFYAFITGVEYVNNATSEISFVIDSLQTYLFNISLKESFVDREHSITDEIGDNLIDEGLPIGEYVTDDFDSSGHLGALNIVVAATFDQSFNETDGSKYGGIYSGLCYTVFPNTNDGVVACSQFLTEASRKGKAEEVSAVFLAPRDFCTGRLSEATTYNISKEKKLTKIAGITPKNNKLFTYPYNFLYVTNLQGGSSEYCYEYFSGNSCNFIIGGDMSPSMALVLAPLNYKGASVNYDEKISLTGYPQCTYLTNTFTNWVSQNSLQLTMDALLCAIGPMTGAVYGGVKGAMGGANLAMSLYGAEAVGDMAMLSGGIGATKGAFSALGPSLQPLCQDVITASSKMKAPMKANGSVGSGTLCALGIMDFAFMHKHIRAEYVRIIDDYFNMFGYKTNRVKVPNINVRPHWTYTKTVGCNLIGNAPSDDVRKICKIFDNGITFWNNPSEVGNYSLDNSPN